MADLNIPEAVKRAKELRKECDHVRYSCNDIGCLAGPNLRDVEALAALVERLTEAVMHQGWCRSCAEDPTPDTPECQAVVDVLAEARAALGKKVPRD